MKKAKLLDTACAFQPRGIDQNETGMETGAADADPGRKAMLSRLRQLETENRDLRRANEVLRHAAMYFARRKSSGY